MTIKIALLATAMLTSAVAVPAFAQMQPATAPAATPAAAAPATAGTPQLGADGKVAIAAGAPVLDASGGAVGTIASVANNVAVVDTGTVKASIPVSSFAQSDKGVHISMTKAQLEAAAAGAQQQQMAALEPGVAVSDSAGGAVGKIDSVDGEYVVVATPNAKVKLPKTAFAKGPNGAVIGMTLAQLEAAAKGASTGG